MAWSRKHGMVGAIAAAALIATAAVPAQAGSILYYTDGNNGTDEMAAALAALSPGDTTTVATSTSDFATKIASGTYQLGIFAAQESYGPNYSAALAALETFVAGGGKAIVDSWFTPGASDISPFGADFTGNVNGPAINLSAFNAGVTNPVAITNPTPNYATFSTSFALDATTGVSIAATFLDPGNASGTDGQGAIIVGDGGNSIVNGFLNDTAGTAGEQIYENEIGELLTPAAAPVPEPATLALLGAGLSGLAAIRRRKKA